MDEKTQNAKALLEANHSWPGPYVFKFIVPFGEKTSLLSLLGEHKVQKEAPSKTGKYLSLTIEKQLENADAVLMQYQKVKDIKGLISL